MIRNTPRGTPARVLILFGLLASVVVISALRDARRPELARIGYPTAVGDVDYHKPGTAPLRVAVHGSYFTLEDASEHLQRRDDQMFRVPLAVSSPRLYTTSEAFPEDRIPPLYLKTAPGDFVRVELRKAQAPDGAAAPVADNR